jgi:hypothetical protein
MSLLAKLVKFIPRLYFLSGSPATHDLTGWKVVGTLSIDPSEYKYSTATMVYLAYTTNAAAAVQVRLYNVTTEAQIGTTKTSTSTSTAKLTDVITLTAGENIYEVQISSETDSTAVVCAGAYLDLV